MTMADVPPYAEEVSVETRINSPAHFLIKIEKFSLLSKHGLQKYESREFAAGDYKWKLIIYPDDCQSDEHSGENKVGYISVYLAMAETSSLPVNWEVNAMFNILLYNQSLDNYLSFRGNMCRFHKVKSEWGLSKMISKESFSNPSNGFLVGDNCFFGAEVFVLKSQLAFERLSLQDCTDPEKFSFKIPNYSKITLVWNSEEFSAGGCRWRIQLYPNGNGSAIGKSISIFLECLNLSSTKKVKVDYWFRIKDQIDDGRTLSKHCSKWLEDSNGWGWISFASIEDIRSPKLGYVVNDCCILEAEIDLQATTSDTS